MVRRFWFIGIQYTYVNIICLSQAWVQLLEMTFRGYWLNWMMMVMMELTNEKGLYNSQCLNLQLVVCWQVLGEYLPFSNRQKRRKHGHDDNQTFSVLIESHQTNTGWYITPLMIMYQYKFYENINSEIQNFYINSIYKYHLILWSSSFNIIIDLSGILYYFSLSFKNYMVFI